jgi:hypothetical protein
VAGRFAGVLAGLLDRHPPCPMVDGRIPHCAHFSIRRVRLATDRSVQGGLVRCALAAGVPSGSSAHPGVTAAVNLCNHGVTPPGVMVSARDAWPIPLTSISPGPLAFMKVLCVRSCTH